MLDFKRAQVSAHCQIVEHPSRYLSQHDLFCGGKNLCASAEPSSISFHGMAHADTAQPLESIILFSLFMLRWPRPDSSSSAQEAWARSGTCVFVAISFWYYHCHTFLSIIMNWMMVL